MRSTLLTILLSICALTALSAEPAKPKTEVLIKENFEKLALDKLPAGISVIGKTADALIAITESAPRGKVLHCTVKGEAKDSVWLQWTLDPKKLAGVEVRIAYSAVAGKFEVKGGMYDRPRVSISGTYPDNKYWIKSAPMPEPNKTEWQALSEKVKIPDGLKDLRLRVGISKCVSECWFDDLTVDYETTKAAPAGAAAAKAGDDDLIAKTPLRTLEEHRIHLSPAVAKSLKAAMKGGLKAPDKHVVLFIGPQLAASEKEKDKGIPPAPDTWKHRLGPPSLTAASVTGFEALKALPEVLAKQKPGFVVILLAPKGKQFSQNESQDWHDVARQCLRYGAIPILAVPDADADDATRNALRAMASTGNFPAVDFANKGGMERLGTVLGMLDVHVFGYVSGKQPVEE